MGIAASRPKCLIADDCLAIPEAAEHSSMYVLHVGLFHFGLYHARASATRPSLMEKSIYTDEYGVLLALLRATRQSAGITQVQLAKKIGQSQGFLSKIEIGDRRLDVIQLRTICHALGTTLPEFVTNLEQRLAAKRQRKR